MLTENNRAFKEWAVACDALRDGRQILLVRKGGIREEGGALRMTDSEFFMMPTFEHQKRDLLQPDILPRIDARSAAPDPAFVEIDTYVVVDSIHLSRNEDQVNAAAFETIWNAAYVKQRFDFNAYDPLFLVILRAFRLETPVTIPLLGDYVGCRSWVTLDRTLSNLGAVPALSDAQFEVRRTRVLEKLQSPALTV